MMHRAVQFAREARAVKDDEGTQQFLSSMLVKSPGRPEGLQIMRDMMAEAPGPPGSSTTVADAMAGANAMAAARARDAKSFIESTFQGNVPRGSLIQ